MRVVWRVASTEGAAGFPGGQKWGGGSDDLWHITAEQHSQGIVGPGHVVRIGRQAQREVAEWRSSGGP
jgi:hypothetical protein